MTEPVDCDTDPCTVDDLASVSWSGEGRGGWTGFELTSGHFHGDALLLVATPYTDPSTVTALDIAGLELHGVWRDTDPEDSSRSTDFGATMAVNDDGSRIAVGASDGAGGPSQDGAVYVFPHPPSGEELVEDWALRLVGDLHYAASFGTRVKWLDLSGDGVDLVVGCGNVQPDLESNVYRFDAGLTGEHGVDAATAAIRGSAFFGQYLAGWDSDGDGLDELVSSADDGVAHFAAPWTGDRVEGDADVRWFERDPVDQFGTTLETVGDLDGDGRADLAIGANTYGATVERGGGLWLVPAGPIADATSEELVYAFVGTEVGEGVGSAAASGDVDGDGAADLLVGAMGLVPSDRAGDLYLYLGPLAPSLRTAADADVAVRGEAAYDMFGRDIVTLDADGDALDDVVVSAQSWRGRGKVYLLAGADLVP